MKPRIITPQAAMLVAMVTTGIAQAADSPPDVKLFSLSGTGLRSPVLAGAEGAGSAPNSASASFQVTTSRASAPLELSQQVYQTMNGAPLLTAPVVQSEPGGAYGFVKNHVFDPITTLEVVKFKKVQFTGGIVGAVKKKNPFCLLNPLIFAVDW